VIVIII